ncbi:MAG TPA: hypothetical protein VF209_03635 [Patescibacteria group bacterium]
MLTSKRVGLFFSGILAFGIVFALGWFANAHLGNSRIALQNPFIDQKQIREKPLQQYSFTNLANREYLPADIKIERTLETRDDFTSYLFSYMTTDRKITGVLNVPTNAPASETLSAIVMIRGWVPKESYYSGMGTENAAAVLARNGYVTLAPDFLGHGESDPEVDDEWGSRFIRPIHVIELIKGVQQKGVPTAPATSEASTLQPIASVGLWGHSNGGQIAMSVLEITGEPMPTVLWAPVLAPFPYSILYFSDEEYDEGKATRKIVTMLEEDYDVFDFTITQHLDRLTAPIQLHHGTADEAAPIVWSDEFMEKVERENERRATVRAELETRAATDSAAQAELDDNEEQLSPIAIDYFRYPGANHNLQPGWDTVVQRNLQFYNQNL